MTQSHTHKEDEALQVADADIGRALLAWSGKRGYSDIERMRAALESFAASRPVAVGVSAAWVPSKRDQSLCPPEYRDYGGGYQHGYTSGWNDCLRRIEEERASTTKAGGAS